MFIGPSKKRLVEALIGSLEYLDQYSSQILAVRLSEYLCSLLGKRRAIVDCAGLVH